MVKRIFMLLSVLVAVVGFISLNSAFATTITSSSDPALNGAAVIDFESQPVGPFTSLTIANVTFSTSAGKKGYLTDVWNGTYNATGRSMENNLLTDSFTFLRFDFITPVNAFGFNMGASNEDWVLRAYNSSNSLLEAFTLPQTWWSNAGEFYGIAFSNMAYLTLTQETSVNEPGGIDHIIMDNFKYVTTSAVPEPSTMLLLGAGLLGLAGFRKRFKK